MFMSEFLFFFLSYVFFSPFRAFDFLRARAHITFLTILRRIRVSECSPGLFLISSALLFRVCVLFCFSQKPNLFLAFFRPKL